MNKRYQLEVSRVRNASRHDLVNYNVIIMGVFVLGRRFFTNVFYVYGLMFNPQLSQRYGHPILKHSLALHFYS